ncbi:ribonuclease H-like domain-containing protein [Tanacetum coccineum]
MSNISLSIGGELSIWLSNVHHSNCTYVSGIYDIRPVSISFDDKNAFYLSASVEDCLICIQPLGFRDPRIPDHFVFLQKSLYGLKGQAPRAGFHKRLFLQATFAADSISSLHQEFSMTDLGPLNYFLGISVSHNDTGMFLHQRQYALEVLERAGMLNCHPCRTPVDTERKLGADGVSVSDLTLYRSLSGSLSSISITHLTYLMQFQQICLYSMIHVSLILRTQDGSVCVNVRADTWIMAEGSNICTFMAIQLYFLEFDSGRRD